MLRQRVITALAMAIIGLAALFFLPPPAFAAAAAVLLAGLGGWEAARLAGLDHLHQRLALAALLLAACLGLAWLAPGLALRAVLIAVAVIWLLNFLWLGRPALGGQGTAGAVVAKTLILGLVLVGAWLALVWLQARSPWLVVLLLILITAADTCAYFTGRHFGGPKLAPRISPGKTWSGVLGGLLGAMLLTAGASAILPDMPFTPVFTAGLALIIAPASVGGDLFISLLKRQRGLKDTSSLLPGHGGVLDRFDSLSAALPLFALAVMIAGH